MNQREQRRTEYERYINSAEWRDVRRRYRESKRPWRCHVCSSGKQLHLHHRTYKRFGHEWLMDLVPLCEMCHRDAHMLVRTGGASLWDAAEKLKKQRQVATPERVVGRTAADERRRKRAVKKNDQRQRRSKKKKKGETWAETQQWWKDALHRSRAA